jgi:hypothetical protein
MYNLWGGEGEKELYSKRNTVYMSLISWWCFMLVMKIFFHKNGIVYSDPFQDTYGTYGGGEVLLSYYRATHSLFGFSADPDSVILLNPDLEYESLRGVVRQLKQAVPIVKL